MNNRANIDERGVVLGLCTWIPRCSFLTFVSLLLFRLQPGWCPLLPPIPQLKFLKFFAWPIGGIPASFFLLFLFNSNLLLPFSPLFLSLIVFFRFDGSVVVQTRLYEFVKSFEDKRIENRFVCNNLNISDCAKVMKMIKRNNERINFSI